jgi:hypothetical protein
MSILVDKICCKDAHQEIDNIWYIAKPLKIKSIKNFLRNIKDSFRVLSGKSFAVHYKSDENEK